MRIKDQIANDYFEWLCSIVCDERFSDETSHRKLLMCLHNTPFTYSMKMDENQYYNGVNLRNKYARVVCDRSVVDYLDEPCSVFEMMIALSIQCERDIMDNTQYGDRTSQWFWGMVRSLGLNGMYDVTFDCKTANDILERFLERKYEPDGRGGLFTIRNCASDLTKVEIWTQMCWYLDTIM